MAVVTVLIVWSCNCKAVGLPVVVSADTSVDQLCVSPLGALPFILSSLLQVVPRLGSPIVSPPSRSIRRVFGQRRN